MADFVQRPKRVSPRLDRQVRWGIIGCGDVTEKKSGPALDQTDRSRIVAVMRRDGAKAADYAKRHYVPKWYCTVEELLDDEEVNAVYLATPPGSHLEIALKVAAKGLPLYCEKPAARNARDCVAMAQAFADENLPLYVAYYRRAYPRYVSVKDSISKGRLGPILSVSYVHSRKRSGTDAGWRVDAALSGGGHFVDVGSHALDLLDFIFDRPLEDVRGRASGPPGRVETKVDMTFVIDGVRGEASWDFESDRDEDLLVITGQDSTLRCPDVMNGTDIVWSKDGRDLITETNQPPNPVQGPLVALVVNALIDGEPCPSTAKSSWRASKAIDDVLDTYYKGRQDDFWTRPDTWKTTP